VSAGLGCSIGRTPALFVPYSTDKVVLYKCRNFTFYLWVASTAANPRDLAGILRLVTFGGSIIPLSMACPLWVSAMSNGDSVGHSGGRNGEFCVTRTTNMILEVG